MPDLQAMSRALDADKEFRVRWELLRVKWDPRVDPRLQRPLRLRRRLLAEIKTRLEAGQRDPDKITAEVCHSLIGVIFITAVVQALVQIMVRRLLEWWEERGNQAMEGIGE